MQTADFTIADVLAWARTKPERRRYEYLSDRCAVGQFLVETVRSANPTMGGTWFRHESEAYPVMREFPKEIDKAASERPRTFGGFVKRLEQVSA